MSVTASSAVSCIRLPLSFDPVRLHDDLVALEDLDWPPEAPFIMKTPFAIKTQTYHDGKWKGLALRSQGGTWTRTDPGGPGLEQFADSDLLARTPYLREVVDKLDCQKRSIRLLSLPAGAEVGMHVDPYHGFKFGQVRLHCPIVTHPDVKMYFEDRSYHWSAGELWYADFGRPHKVVNRSSLTRIHLVLDVMISPGLLRLFPPDFVVEQYRVGILMQETPTSLSSEQMQRLSCEFGMPAALIQGILETDDGSVSGEVDCRIRVQGSQFVMFIAQTPVFRLVPVGANRFTLAGWTPERFIELETGRDGRTTTVIFRLRAGKNETIIRLPARS